VYKEFPEFSLLPCVGGRFVGPHPEIDRAANAAYLATEEGRRGLMLALITEVAQSYLELVELDRRLAVARDSRDAFEATHVVQQTVWSGNCFALASHTRGSGAGRGGRNPFATVGEADRYA
jgi:hypothetical protein